MTRTATFVWVLYLALCFCSHALGEFDQTEAERAQPKLREYFEKAPFFPFEYDSMGEAVIRLIGTPQESFIFEQGRYFGFRFKTPAKITGDFRWFFLMSNPDGPVTMNDFAWYILRKAGDMKGFSTYRRDPLDYYPRLKSRFPHTGGVIIQTLSDRHLLPNEEYLIWFRVRSDENIPPMAVAFTLPDSRQSPQPQLPLSSEPLSGSVQPSSAQSSIEGDPW